MKLRHFKLEHSESTDLCYSSIMMVYLFIVGWTIIKSSGTSLDSDLITINSFRLLQATAASACGWCSGNIS